MPNRTSLTGSELFIVDNSDTDWKVLKYLHDWCQIFRAIDIAKGYFEIGSLLTLNDEWQKVDKIRILMGDEVSKKIVQTFPDERQVYEAAHREKVWQDKPVGAAIPYSDAKGLSER